MSSDSDLDDTADEHDCANAGQHDFSEDLASWASRNKLTRSTLWELLQLLRKEGHDLPKDPRTLLCTPRTIQVDEKLGGTYSYFGVEPAIRETLGNNPWFESHYDSIELQVNIDGVPLFKSSSSQFWPILVQFHSFKPCIVALFYGTSKPNCVAGFLRDFLNEYEALKQTGITHGAKVFSVSIRCFVCDAPARSFIKCTKGHTGYHACERCEITGEWRVRRVTLYSRQPHPLRTDHDFSQEKYRNTHQKGRSPLIDYQIPCVTSFPLDYMHLLCLGVVRRILIFLKSGPRICRLSNQQLNIISANMLALSGKLPREFARQPRSLKELDRFKATELRQFLLYTGPLVLRNVVHPTLYKHFLALTIAAAILLEEDDAKRNYYLQYARELLEFFVNKSKSIYGDSFCVYNVHCLTHLADDAEHYQCSLNDICGFPFENHLQTVKKFVRQAKNPIAQVGKRLTELEKTGVKNKEKKALYRFVSTKPQDSCFLSKDEDYIFVREKREDGFYLCDIISNHHIQNFFTDPCESKVFNIGFLRDNTRSRRKMITSTLFTRKVVCLPCDRGHVLIPMLHGDEHC